MKELIPTAHYLLHWVLKVKPQVRPLKDMKNYPDLFLNENEML